MTAPERTTGQLDGTGRGGGGGGGGAGGGRGNGGAAGEAPPPLHREVEPPKQARSRRSYHRILEAATELLADRPFDDITVDDIVDRAGYTKGAFYARFDSKAALLRHLVARLTDGALEAWDTFLDAETWRDAALADVAEAFVRRMTAIYTRSGNVMRAIDREIRTGGDPAVRATVDRLNDRVRDAFVRLVRSRSDELPAGLRNDVEGACDYWLMALVSVLRSGLLHADTGLPGGSPDDVAERTVRLMVPYLTGAR